MTAQPASWPYSATGRVSPVWSQLSCGLKQWKPSIDVPAVVLAARAGPRDIDLFPGVLAHVADPEVARRPVEPHPPRVPQPAEPDLRFGVRLADERVIGRDRVRGRGPGCVTSMRRILARSVPRFWPFPLGSLRTHHRRTRCTASRRCRTRPRRRCGSRTADPDEGRRARWPCRPDRAFRPGRVNSLTTVLPSGRCSRRRTGDPWESSGGTRDRGVRALRRWRSGR